MAEKLADTPLLTERFDRAMQLALDHHRMHLRKGTALPYATQAILADHAVHGAAVWTRFTGSPTRIAWYYRSLAHEFKAQATRMGPAAAAGVDAFAGLAQDIAAAAAEAEQA